MIDDFTNILDEVIDRNINLMQFKATPIG